MKKTEPISHCNRQQILLSARYRLLLVIISLMYGTSAYSQSCPTNLNFNLGYPYWNYYAGYCGYHTDPVTPYSWHWTSASYGTTPPASTMTQIVNATTNLNSTGLVFSPVVVGGYDYFGNFPVVPPTMAGFPASTSSLLLNGPLSDTTISKAEYVFIPSLFGVKSLGYQYAVVMENPGHPDNQNPRFVVVAIDNTSGDTIGCTDFTYVSGIYAGSPVPFSHSSQTFNSDTFVYYLPWQTGSIDLSSVPSGHMVTISFMTGSCSKVFGHFCYAYISMACSPWQDTISTCYPGTVTLSYPSPGYQTYQWYLGSTLIATGSTPPTVTVAATPITYKVVMTPYPGFGCLDSLTVTVLPLIPYPIHGDTTVCVGSSITLSNQTSGGTWSSHDPSVATVTSGTGIVTGITSGNALISYASSIGGCISTFTVDVYPTPTASATSYLCGGSTIGLTDYPSGGTWSSNNTAVATVGSSTGIVTALPTSGTVIISYTLPNGCASLNPVVVVPTPTPFSAISLCQGQTQIISETPAGWAWGSANPGIATFISGNTILGVSAGTTTITYTVGGGCMATNSVVVHPIPGPITGTDTVCAGATISLTDATAGGTWTSSNTAIATVFSSTGTVSGVSAGTTVISYTNAGGCAATTTVTVLPLPANITGTDSLCVGNSTTLSDAICCGNWSSNNTSVVTIVSATGELTGISGGTSVITYTLASGCGMTTATVTVKVNPLPDDATGVMGVCVGSTTILSDGTAGGTWSSASTVIATAGSGTGIMTGISAGTSTITYTLSTGCYSTTTLTVNPLPDSIIGNSACQGTTVTLSDGTPGGIWTGSNTLIATIGSSTGTVSAVSTGTVTITYTSTFGCIAMETFTVNALPGSITGPTSVCLGSSIHLSDATSGGIWTSSNIAIATIDPTSGVLWGISEGGVTITYTAGTGCIATTTVSVDILPFVYDITGGFGMCIPSTETLTDIPPGGVWTSSNSAVATIDPSTGVVTSVSAGTTTITYTYTNACGTGSEVKPIEVYPQTPPTLTGITSICLGGTTSLSNSADDGGTWSSSSTAVATIDPVTGVVTSVSAGTTTISYVSTNYGGCVTTATVNVTVNPLPAGITGSSTVCVGSTISLSDGSAGGAWASSNNTMATIDGSGTVTGNSGGIVTITYTLPTGCLTTQSLTVFGPPANISSVVGICSGNTITISNIVGGGAWSSSNTSIATVDPVTGVITAVTTGLDTVTYVASGVCGTFSVTETVSVNMPPYITTNFIVSCSSLGSTGEYIHILNDSAGCIDVCENRVIRYYANGVIGSVFSWAVTGGTVVYNYGDSIDVIWPTPGTTVNITLTDSAGSCSGTSSECLRVISGPHAAFSASEISACLNSSVSFTDMSTFDPLSPITSWLWNFGDGGYSVLPDPVHTFTTASSNDTVSLTVRNACGCTDTFRMVLNIVSNPGPVITCPSIVCDSQSATYSIPNTGCGGSYLWSVTGGTITSGAGSTSITVAWNNVDPSGYGYVSVADPCSVCSDTTTIKIPVILATDTITGPDIVCTGNEYQYSLPLWPATQYMWGVPGQPGAVVGYHDDHKVVLNFSTPGTYWLHGWYQNTIKLCGANLYKKIRVRPSTAISGPTAVCTGDSPTYTVGGLYATWVVSDASSGTVLNTSTGTSVTYPSPPAGTYALNATGHFCVDPIIVSVVPTAIPLDSLKGPDTVCLNRVYTYVAYGSGPVSWSAIGGTVSLSAGEDTVNVVWTSSGTKQLTVSSSVTCGSASLTKNVQQEIINPVVTGNTNPCANSHQTYSTAYTRGEVYDWSIYPNTAGSVVSGDHTPGINVLWNNVSGASLLAAEVILTVHKCDSIVKDTLQLSVLSPTVTLTSSINPVCPGALITFTASIGGSSYAWNFGDGSAITTTANTVIHTFPSNTTSSNVSYLVTVTVMPDASYACPAAGVSTLTEVVLPGPVANPSFSGNLCDGPTLISGNVPDIGGAFTYQWFNVGGPISGATNMNYTATTINDYTLQVTSSDGCSSLATVSMDSCTTTCGSIISATVTTTGCGQITVSATDGGGTSPIWVAVSPVSSGPQTVSFTPGGTHTATFTYDEPGYYHFQYRETLPGGCENQADVTGVVYEAPKFTYNISCAPGGVDNVTLTDNSVFLPGWGVSTINWSDAAGALGTGTPLTVPLSAPGTYVVNESVLFTNTASIPPLTCVATQTISLPAQPTSATADFTYTLSPICEGIPITFTPVTAGAYSYSWDFGDGAFSLLQNTQRTYTWGGGFPTENETVTLNITDGFNCSASASHTMQIQENTMNGGLGGNQVVCPPNAPLTLAFAPAPGSYPVVSYLWSTAATTSTISVNTSGAYWVTVTGLYQCQATITSPATQITIVHIPPVHIAGNLGYCYGDGVQLSGDVGTGVAYQWYLDGADDGTNSTVNDAGISVGDHTYQLIISVPGTGICPETTSVVVHVYDQPPTPVITGPLVVDCNSYHLQLTASEPLPGYFNWSDGNIGATDDIYAGGIYRVIFTSLGGCEANAQVYVEPAPELSLQYFPTGCYDICKQQLPLTLYGPPDQSFTQWRWQLNGSVVEAGTGLMSPYSVVTGGLYTWLLANGLCAKKSDTMGVTVEDCSHCKSPLTASIKCDSSNPASFTLTVGLFSLSAGTTYTIGTNIGPVTPFSGILPGTGPYSLTLTFTTLAVPAPSTIEVEVSYEDSSGNKCFQTVIVRVPSCTWVAERSGDSTSNATPTPLVDMATLANALLVFPNPASGSVTVSYDYGTGDYMGRSLEVYDMMGRKVAATTPGEVHGNWILDMTNWTAGVYIVRMEADGKTLQTQRLVITH